MSNGGSYQLLINKLDAFIRKFYLNRLIKGSLYTIGAIGALFLLFTVLEYNFYFSTGVRKFFFYSFLLIGAAATAHWVIRPLLNYFKLGERISHEQAAGIIGQHFTNVSDKLLNILQLHKELDSSVSHDLVLASIDQKSEEIKLVSFPSAINLSLNRKYLRYALPPLLIITGILLTAPSVITDSTTRIIKNSEEFKPDAPFDFIIQNPDLQVKQFENFNLVVQTKGALVPEEAFIDIDGSQYRLKKGKNNQFNYTFNTVKNDLSFKLISGPVESETYDLSVLLRPQIAFFDTELDYPPYTGYKDENMENTGDLIVPQGTKATWSFKTLNANDILFKLGENDSESVDQRGEGNFIYSRRLLQSGSYKVYVKNDKTAFTDSVIYNINVIPDQYPSISLKVFEDSTDQSYLYFVGDASDDYGLKRLNFNYRITREKGSSGELVSIPVNITRGSQTKYDYQWDISSLDLGPGDELTYYFEVFDNDGINGSKSSKSAIQTFKLPTKEEIKEKVEANSKEIKDKLENNVERSREIQKELQKLREKLLQSKEPQWEDRKKLEDLMKEQQQIQSEFEKAKQQFQENMKNESKLSRQELETLDKQEKLQEMFEEVINEDMQKLMEEIQKLMEELEKDTAIEKMEDMKMSQEEIEEEMDRLLELYKQLELEKEIQEAIEDLEKLAEKQEELSEKTEQKQESNDKLQEQQQDINKEFDDIQKKMDDIQKKNEELERPQDLDDPEEEMEDIEQDLNQSQEQLQQQNNSGASKKQKSAAGKMKQMANSLAQQQQQEQAEQQEEDIKTIRQLLENLVALSFDQEDLVTYVGRTNPSTPTYVEYVQDEYKLKDDFGLIKDSLEALAKRNFQIESYIMEKTHDISTLFESTIDHLEERDKGRAGDGQRRIMKNVNDLALMLSESMQKMQEDLANKIPGNQMCNKPGGSGKSGKVPMDKISKGQKSMSEELEKLKDGLKQGKGEKMSKEFAKAAARQAALRRALEELQKSKQEEGKGSQGLQEIIDQMDKMEIDLVNKRLDNEAFKRQQDIVTRLLEAEKSERQRERDEKRESTTAQEVERKLPPNIEEYLKQRDAELEQYERVSPELRPYYKLLVEKYYKHLKTSSE